MSTQDNTVVSPVTLEDDPYAGIIEYDYLLLMHEEELLAVEQDTTIGADILAYLEEDDDCG